AGMQRVVDEFDEVHFICQRLSCGYEEVLVKEVVKATKTLQATPASYSAGGKRVVVVKKRESEKVSLPKEVSTTKIKVVSPSRYIPQREEPKRKEAPTDSGGTTLGELLAASERRNRERDRKKKR
ncbi:MAG: hypothetical protein WCR26_02060, partial [Sphaerochaetaceae bacterium]